MFDTLYVLSNEDTVAHGFAKGTAVSVSPQASLNTYSIFFNGVLPNETISEMVTISNSSELASLSIEQITSNNDAFYVTDHSVNVGPLSSYDLEIFFTPNQIGLQSGELTLATSDFYNHHITIELRGLGSSQNQNIIIETDSLVFLGSIVGVSNTKSFTIYNGGINELNIEDIFVSPPFSVNPSYGIVPGVSDQGIINSIVIDVICEASTATNGNISIYSDDPDSPEYIIPVSFRLNEEFAFVNDLTVPISQDFGSSSGTAIADLNNDGLLDMLVANRAGTKNKYYLQQQDHTFLSYELNPNVENDSENFTVADIHNDGRMTIVQTDLLNESTTLMHSVSCHFIIDQFNEDGQIDYNDDGSIPYISDNIY